MSVIVLSFFEEALHQYYIYPKKGALQNEREGASEPNGIKDLGLMGPKSVSCSNTVQVSKN